MEDNCNCIQTNPKSCVDKPSKNGRCHHQQSPESMDENITSHHMLKTLREEILRLHSKNWKARLKLTRKYSQAKSFMDRWKQKPLPKQWIAESVGQGMNNPGSTALLPRLWNGGSVISCACMAASGTSSVIFIDVRENGSSRMKSEVYRKILSHYVQRNSSNLISRRFIL